MNTLLHTFFPLVAQCGTMNPNLHFPHFCFFPMLSPDGASQLGTQLWGEVCFELEKLPEFLLPFWAEVRQESKLRSRQSASISSLRMMESMSHSRLPLNMSSSRSAGKRSWPGKPEPSCIEAFLLGDFRCGCLASFWPASLSEVDKPACQPGTEELWA